MFHILSTSSRTALLRSSTASRCVKLSYATSTKTSTNSCPSDYLKKPRSTAERPAPTEQHEIASYLYEAYGGGRKRRPQGDNRRVNIVSKKLCDDTIERLKHSLLKHTGCDIIDVNPGAGVWSAAIHDLLKPRNHILMEPDHKLYEPLLQPLLDAEGSTYKFIPKSGAVWANLQRVLTPEVLPQQVEYEAGDPRLDQPNNTLLFIANLGWYPKKSYRSFPSISTLVIHQLLTAVRAHSLFHKYGLVRMLIWVGDEERGAIMPRTIHMRKKMTIEAEATCSEIIEVASTATDRTNFRRDHQLNLESSVAVLKKMEEAGITTPTGREGPLQLEASKVLAGEKSMGGHFVDRNFLQELQLLEKSYASKELKKHKVDSALIPKRVLSPEWARFKRLEAYMARLKKLGKPISAKLIREYDEFPSRFASGEIQKYATQPGLDPSISSLKQWETPEYDRLRKLRSRFLAEQKKQTKWEPLFQDFEVITEMEKKVLTLERAKAEDLQQRIDERTTAFQEAVWQHHTIDRNEFNHLFDNRRTFKNDPPLLYFDRRPYEPLKVAADEFFPTQEMCLLDFHPKAIWQVFRDDFPANYDVFEYIVSSLIMLSTQSVRQGFTALAPGAFEWLISECPSITDPNKGGSPNLDLLTVRCLTQEMYKEIIEAWMRWPFRPSRYELMAKMGSIVFDPSDEDTV